MRGRRAGRGARGRGVRAPDLCAIAQE
jgi:hypothetical protein